MIFNVLWQQWIHNIVEDIDYICLHYVIISRDNLVYNGHENIRDRGSRYCRGFYPT